MRKGAYSASDRPDLRTMGLPAGEADIVLMHDHKAPKAPLLCGSGCISGSSLFIFIILTAFGNAILIRNMDSCIVSFYFSTFHFVILLAESFYMQFYYPFHMPLDRMMLRVKRYFDPYDTRIASHFMLSQS